MTALLAAELEALDAILRLARLKASHQSTLEARAQQEYAYQRLCASQVVVRRVIVEAE